MAITAAQMNTNIVNWNERTAALRTEFNTAQDSARIDRDIIVDDRTIGKALLQFQESLVKDVDLVEAIKQSVTAFKREAFPELAATVDKAKDAWAKAILVVQTGHEDAQQAKKLYSKDDISLIGVQHLYDDFSAVFPPANFLAFV
jgi:hypothetical protein